MTSRVGGHFRSSDAEATADPVQPGGTRAWQAEGGRRPGGEAESGGEGSGQVPVQPPGQQEGHHVRQSQTILLRYQLSHLTITNGPLMITT